jgi:FixJ family two-component response regulator
MKRGRPAYPEVLTPREQEVLALLREGMTNQQIADWLGSSEAGRDTTCQRSCRSWGFVQAGGGALGGERGEAAVVADTRSRSAHRGSTKAG